MSSSSYPDYFQDILEVSEKACSFIIGISFAQFKTDDKTLFACIRALEIIGEAANKIPKEVQNKYPDIPWKEVVGMRNKLIHDYMGVNKEVVWKTIQEDLPELEKQIKKVIE